MTSSERLIYVQFTSCVYGLIWMFQSRSLNNKINSTHERALSFLEGQGPFLNVCE